MKSTGIVAAAVAGSLAVATLATTATAAAVTSLTELNAHLDTAGLTTVQRQVGFLTEGNYQRVENELSSNVVKKIYDSSAALHDAVENGTVVAGLVSGTPDASRDFNIFPSEQISVRSMLVKPGNDAVLDAIDAALVRAMQAGGVEKTAKANPGYEALVVHSCQLNPSLFPWPEESVLRSAIRGGNKIRIAALGPYNWGKADGNYLVTPFTGFWPEYYNLIEAEVTKQYGSNFGFERVWYKTSHEAFISILNGTTDATEPYMFVGSAYNKTRGRKSVFDLSCFTGATQDKYFSKKKVAGNTQTVFVAVAAVLGACLLLSLFMIQHMYHREVQGDPVFKAQLLEGTPAAAVAQSRA